MGVRLTAPIPVPFPRAAPSPGMTTTTPSVTLRVPRHPFACEGELLNSAL
jgi:hypothetical protein